MNCRKEHIEHSHPAKVKKTGPTLVRRSGWHVEIEKKMWGPFPRKGKASGCYQPLCRSNPVSYVEKPLL